jgi:hypothetical protein
MTHRSLRIKITFIILIFSSSCFAQEITDYEIYYAALSGRFKEWKVNIDTVKRIVVSNKLTISDHDEGTLNSAIDDILRGYNQDLVLYSRNDFKVFEYLKNDSIKQLLEEFKYLPEKSVTLEKTGFGNNGNIELVDFMDIYKIFKDHYYEKEWKKFYKKYPNSHGFYQFSQIAKSPEFAVLYLVQRANPLNASACLVGLRKKDGIWTVIFNLYLWQS